mmetsp:Transcript_17928/g.35007  ORF Transcript_17928/g.35007 Transcript_17928/m.35007 type:complete len:516 (-) Transcript_17928:13-1560(-)
MLDAEAARSARLSSTRSLRDGNRNMDRRAVPARTMPAESPPPARPRGRSPRRKPLICLEAWPPQGETTPVAEQEHPRFRSPRIDVAGSRAWSHGLQSEVERLQAEMRASTAAVGELRCQVDTVGGTLKESLAMQRTLGSTLGAVHVRVQGIENSLMMDTAAAANTIKSMSTKLPEPRGLQIADTGSTGTESHDATDVQSADTISSAISRTQAGMEQIGYKLTLFSAVLDHTTTKLDELCRRVGKLEAQQQGGAQGVSSPEPVRELLGRSLQKVSVKMPPWEARHLREVSRVATLPASPALPRNFSPSILKPAIPRQLTSPMLVRQPISPVLVKRPVPAGTASPTVAALTAAAAAAASSTNPLTTSPGVPAILQPEVPTLTARANISRAHVEPKIGCSRVASPALALRSFRKSAPSSVLESITAAAATGSSILSASAKAPSSVLLVPAGQITAQERSSLEGLKDIFKGRVAELKSPFGPGTPRCPGPQATPPAHLRSPVQPSGPFALQLASDVSRR